MSTLGESVRGWAARAAGALLIPSLPQGTTTAVAQVPALCAQAGNQADANACAARKLAEADVALNDAYAALVARLDDNGKRNLTVAERAWIAYRDQECYLRTGYDVAHPERNGTIMPLLVGECRTDLTQRRTADLKQQIKCPGGDLSCQP